MCVCAIINMHPVGHLSWLFARCRRQESASSTPQVPQPVFECCFPKRRLIEIDKDMRPMGATDRTIRKHQHFCGLNSMLLFLLPSLVLYKLLMRYSRAPCSFYHLYACLTRSRKTCSTSGKSIFFDMSLPFGSVSKLFKNFEINLYFV